MSWNLYICLNSTVGGWLDKNGHKKKHHEVTLKVKYKRLKKLQKGGPNKDVATYLVLLVVLLLLWSKQRKYLLNFSKFIPKTTKSENWNIRKVK